jgi:hypothetical protein
LAYGNFLAGDFLSSNSVGPQGKAESGDVAEGSFQARIPDFSGDGSLSRNAQYAGRGMVRNVAVPLWLLDIVYAI